jgi:hypothetical protein
LFESIDFRETKPPVNNGFLFLHAIRIFTVFIVLNVFFEQRRTAACHFIKIEKHQVQREERDLPELITALTQHLYKMTLHSYLAATRQTHSIKGDLTVQRPRLDTTSDPPQPLGQELFVPEVECHQTCRHFYASTIPR